MTHPAAREIHPSAVVAAGARLGPGVSVGAFTVIEEDVTVGAGCRIGPHAVIRRHVRMGERNRVEPFAVLGGPPQDTAFDLDAVSYLEIGDDCTFREGVTIHRSNRPEGITRIGARCFLMNNSHVAHDCVLGDGVIFAAGAVIGGHVQIGDAAFLGGGTMVHQFCRIGALAMVRGLSPVDKDVLPYSMAGGIPVRHYRLNLVGLRRSGLGAERLRVLSTAFRRLRNRALFDELEATPELIHLRAWLNDASKRGVHGFASARGRGENQDA